MKFANFIADARNHGSLGKEKRAKIDNHEMQGKRKYPDELVSIIKAELETNPVQVVADFHSVPLEWVRRVNDGTIRGSVKAKQS